MDEEQRETSNDASKGAEDTSETTAPSIGPNTVIDRSDEKSTEEVREESPEDPDTGLKEIDLDAMGQDKRRQVVGKSYGAGVGKQAAVYAVVVAAVIGVAIGLHALITHFDKDPNPNQHSAPWAQPGTPQKAPKPPE